MIWRKDVKWKRYYTLSKPKQWAWLSKFTSLFYFMAVTKKVKITFWISTVLVAFFTIPSIFVVNLPSSIEMFNHLGVGADWFRWELEWAKTLAGIILILPFIRWRIKEWAYVGLGIDFISAVIAITAVDGIAKGAPVLLFVLVLAISYFTYHAIEGTKTPILQIGK